jgi:hypothetical protein
MGIWNGAALFVTERRCPVLLWTPHVLPPYARCKHSSG